MALIKESAHNYYKGNNLGDYQFVSLENIISNFMISYVGEDKIIPKVKRTDVLFHAKRALQELSYDTFKSIKSQEITLPSSLVMPLPQDYVNYVKLTWSDASGIERIIYPTSKTSNPNSISQDSDENYIFNTGDLTKSANGTPNKLIEFPFELTVKDNLAAGQTVIEIFPHIFGFDPTTEDLTTNPGYKNFPDENPFIEGMEIVSPHFPAGTTIETVTEADSTTNMSITLSHASTNIAPVPNHTMTIIDNTSDTTWGKYKASKPSENKNDDYSDDIYWPYEGGRYGLDPEHAQFNGSFFIDTTRGTIHFSSNISGKKVILKYISDSLGTDAEMQVHKLAEEAMYKWIAHAILSTRLNVSEGLVTRFKKERFAEVRKAKLRLSNLKIEELTQIMRGKSKFIKH